MSLSVIVLCANNKIQNMLECLLPQLDKDDEIIVIDDNSSKEVYKQIECSLKNQNYTIAKSMKNGNRGHNRNLGAKIAHNEHLLFIDGDLLLWDNAITVVKTKLAENPSQCIIAPASALVLDNYQLSLQRGIDDFSNLLTQKDTFYNAIEDDRNRDSRYFTAYQMSSNKSLWSYFWTAFCVIPKQTFQQAGGFDESYIEWGAEDVDLGYRISKICEINFYTEIKMCHLPHYRNVINNEYSNYCNLYYMLSKYNDIAIETHIGFKYLHNSLNIIYDIANYLQSNIYASLNENDIEIDVLYIDHISIQFPNGHIFYINNAGNISRFNLIGMHIPLFDNTFKKVIISENIFLYPETVYCKIINEALRLSDNVIIQKCHNTIRIDWAKIYAKAPDIKNYVASYGFFYIPNSITYFDFKQIDNHSYNVTHKNSYLEINRFQYSIFNNKALMQKRNAKLNEICHNANKASKYIFINLTEQTMEKCPVLPIGFLLKISYITKYSLSVCEKPIKLSQFENLHDYNVNFLFYTNKNSDILEIERNFWNDGRKNFYDLIVDTDGIISPLK